MFRDLSQVTVTKILMKTLPYVILLKVCGRSIGIRN